MDKSYSKRLIRTGLVSLENRGIRSDLIHVFKVLKGDQNADLFQ